MKLESIHKCPVGFHINRTANLMRQTFNTFLKPYDIAAEQYTMLKLIKENPQITQSGLSLYLFKNKTTITRMMDVLEKKEFIWKKKQHSDRRYYSITVTPKGKKLIKEVTTKYDPKIEELNNLFSEEEMDSFTKVIEKFQEFLLKEGE